MQTKKMIFHLRGTTRIFLCSGDKKAVEQTTKSASTATRGDALSFFLISALGERRFDGEETTGRHVRLPKTKWLAS